MDFGTLLHVAKKNSSTSKEAAGKYYSTKFSAPKKEVKEKKLSDNIKKFLAKKEQEEREKARIEAEKRDKLLSMRDEKSKNKIKKMLKVIKSANKSVLEDAVDEQNTSVTLQGPDQPDEDDYGYVSNEAAALYQKYVERTKHIQEDKGFAPSRPQSRDDLCGTKDRVRAALMKEQDEKNNPHRTKSTTSVSSSSRLSSSSSTAAESSKRKSLYDPQLVRELEEREKKKEQEKRREKFKKPLPPPMDFKALLKLAEQKQFEDVESVPEVKKKEPERRLLTSKEKMEEEARQKYLQEREQRKKGVAEKPSNKMLPNGRIPKLNKSAPIPEKSDKIPKIAAKEKQAPPKKSVPTQLPPAPRPFATPRGLANMPSGSRPMPSKPVASSAKDRPPAPSSSKPSTAVNKPASNGQTREFPPKDMKQRPPAAARPDQQKTREFPPRDIQRTRQFPPSDVGRSHSKDKNPHKRRILDDSDEDEYDSELDDFIDDGDAEEDYSSHIKEIFGYDKSKYRYEDVDDAGMESTFAQQMREEYMSKKIGQMEDLEDMRLEEEEKKRKMRMKKKMKLK